MAKKLVPGTFFGIPLEDGSFGYGRVLPDPYFAFYDYRTEEPSDDLAEIESKPILFSTSVRVFDWDRWENIGHRPLQGAVAEPVVQFMQSPVDVKRCTIFDSEGHEYPANPEQCVGLERAAVWEPHQIERRLLDRFMGRPNEMEIRLRVQLE
jgi:Immunity protein 26